MHIPSQLKIGPYTWTVVRKRVRHRNKECYGSECEATQTIELHTKNTDDRNRETLMHEVLHAVSDIYAAGMDEGQVNTLAFGLTQLLRDNPEFWEMYRAS